MKHALVYIGALFDAVYIVTFNIKYFPLVYKDNIILWGWRSHHNKLWHLPLSVENKDEQLGDNKNNLVNNIYPKKQAELETVLYETRFSPIKSAFTKSAKNRNFETWLGSTAKLIAAPLTKSEAAIFRHLD